MSEFPQDGDIGEDATRFAEKRNADLRARLLEHAKAVSRGKPLKSFVLSAVEMSEIVLELFGS